MASLDDLNEAQQVRLLEFAKARGPSWKSTLNAMWCNGKDATCRDGYLLRQIRNDFGPVWLHNLNITKELQRVSQVQRHLCGTAAHRADR